MNVEERKHTLHELIINRAVGYENELSKENFRQMTYFYDYCISEVCGVISKFSFIGGRVTATAFP